MPTQRINLSASTNGRPVPVAATSSPGTTIHTATTDNTTGVDLVYLWASNVTGSSATLTIEFGGTSSANQIVGAYSLAANSLPMPVVTGQQLNNGLIVKAFSGTGNAINLSGYVNRVT